MAKQQARRQRDAEDVEREGLCDPDNLEVIKIWYAFGGQEKPPSLLEVQDLSPALAKDALYFLGVIDERRKERKRKKPKKHAKTSSKR